MHRIIVIVVISILCAVVVRDCVVYSEWRRARTSLGDLVMERYMVKEAVDGCYGWGAWKTPEEIEVSEIVAISRAKYLNNEMLEWSSILGSDIDIVDLADGYETNVGLDPGKVLAWERQYTSNLVKLVKSRSSLFWVSITGEFYN